MTDLIDNIILIIGQVFGNGRCQHKERFPLIAIPMYAKHYRWQRLLVTSRALGLQVTVRPYWPTYLICHNVGPKPRSSCNQYDRYLASRTWQLVWVCILVPGTVDVLAPGTDLAAGTDCRYTHYWYSNSHWSTYLTVVL